MPLQTASQYPGIFAQPDKSGIAQGILNALTGFGQLAERRRLEEKVLLQQKLEQTGLQLLRVRDIQDENPFIALDNKRMELLKLAQEAKQRGNMDAAQMYEQGAAIEDFDQMEMFLTRNATRASQAGDLIRERMKPQEGKVVNDRLVNPVTGEVIADFAEDTPPGYKYVAAHPVGGGQFVAAYVPDDPNQKIIPVSQPYTKKALIDQTINTGVDIPVNHMENPDYDPNQPVTRDNSPIMPIPGGPADPAVRQENLYDEAIAVVDKAEGSLDRYETLFDKHGAEVLPGAAQQELGSAYAAMQLEIKELEQLGVLAGPDMELIERVLSDPLSFKGKLYEFFGGKDGFKAQMQLVRDKIKAARATADRLYGPEQGETEQSESQQEYPEGTIIVNDDTNERMIMRGGQWQPM